MNGSKTTAIVEITAPDAPATLYPTKVAAFIAIGPGVICDIETILTKSMTLNQFLDTSSCCKNPIRTYPPPKLKTLIFANNQKSSNKVKIKTFSNLPRLNQILISLKACP